MGRMHKLYYQKSGDAGCSFRLLAISLQCFYIVFFLGSASSYSCAAFPSYTFIISWLNILE